jgi:hypothetical protein
LHKERRGGSFVVLAGRRAYSDAVRRLKAARPRRIDSGRFAARAFWGSFATGIVVLGALALLAPSSFGTPGARALRGGVWTLALGGLIAVAVIALLLNARHLRWLYARIREPFARPLTENRHLDVAADALAACPESYHSRWATSWVWVPALIAVAGVTFAWSSAYFVVAAVLSGGRVGWGNPVLAAGNAILSLVMFAMGAVRLSTWRLALSVHREVTGRYR